MAKVKTIVAKEGTSIHVTNGGRVSYTNPRGEKVEESFTGLLIVDDEHGHHVLECDGKSNVDIEALGVRPLPVERLDLLPLSVKLMGKEVMLSSDEMGAMVAALRRTIRSYGDHPIISKSAEYLAAVSMLGKLADVHEGFALGVLEKTDD